MTVMRHKKKTVLCLTKYSRMGASSRVRTLQYVEHLRRAGLHVVVQPLFSDRYLVAKYEGRLLLSYSLAAWCVVGRATYLTIRNSFDVVRVEKELFPYVPLFLERLFFRAKEKLIVDYDDGIHIRYENGHWLKKLLLRGKITGVVRAAELVTTGGCYLADQYLLRGAKRVGVFPSVYDQDSTSSKVSETPSSELVIGWIGSPSTSKYLEQIAGVLSVVCDSYKARVCVVGAELTVRKSEHMTFLPWSEDLEGEYISSFDIGLMPLPDEEWERCKSGYKIIQYMAHGKPTIASPVGINATLIADGETGLFASSLDDWKYALEKLITDETLRVNMGVKAKEKQETLLGKPRWADELVGLIRNQLPT